MSLDSTITFQPVPYRIRIGVTGHRRLPGEPAFEALIRKAIDTHIDTLFKEESREKIERARRENAPPVLYSVVTPLAEGADRLVARVVLSYEGSRVDVVLPLTLEDYLEDFENERSRQEFQDLFECCRRPVYLRRRNLLADCQDGDDPAELRRSAYENVGRYVVSHCDILLAVWDGSESHGRGGTAEIVAFARSQGRPVIRVWMDTDEVLEVERANGLDATALEAVARFNRTAVGSNERTLYIERLDEDYFETPSAASEIPEEARQLVRNYLLPYYVVASANAKKHQGQFYRAGQLVYLLSALAVSSVALAILIPKLAALGFGIELVLLALMWFTIHSSHMNRSQETWMENRFLAERIRAGIFLAICGLDAAPIEVLPFMGHAHAVDDWMVRVFYEVWNRLPRLIGCGEGQCLAMNRYVREEWIEKQIRFHNDKREREGRRGKRLAKIGRYLFPVTIMAAALHLCWNVLPAAIYEQHWLHGALTFIAIVFPAVAASLVGLRAQREHVRLENRSAGMARELEYLNRQMASANNPKIFEVLLRQVDEIMLRETQDWLMLMRYVDIETN
jgi:hypothetical protein